jgi:predicted nucleic acid-binding protein
MVLVDSSVWIEAARKYGDLSCKVALEALLEEYEAALCAPVRLEVLGGARSKDRRRLMGYFDSLPYSPLEERDWNAAVLNNWSLRDAGLTIPWNDILVATLALRGNCRVYARDAHFNSMSGLLRLQLYEPGPGGTFSPDLPGA